MAGEIKGSTPPGSPPDLAKMEKSPGEMARWQRAQQQLLAGRGAAALEVYRELTQRFPGILNLWFELGTAAAADLDFPLALQAFDRAGELASANPSVLVMLGQQYHRLRQIDRARAAFQRAVEADPSSTHARLSWAAWLERERRWRKRPPKPRPAWRAIRKTRPPFIIARSLCIARSATGRRKTSCAI